ncbi:MAG: hypothetical protein WD049_03720 [Candidatus Paceibacterota bacterium]
MNLFFRHNQSAPNGYRTLTLGGVLGGAVALPLSAQAAELEAILGSALNIVTSLVVVAFALIVLAFFWGLAKYVFQSGNETAVAEGKRIMIGGILALTVASLIWGIVAFIRGDLGITDVTTIDISEGPGGSGSGGSGGGSSGGGSSGGGAPLCSDVPFGVPCVDVR